MNIHIIVAAHIPYWMPTDAMYLPLQVGRAGSTPLGYTGDDTGDNISAENARYCELTGLYWGWKNLPADYLGLCHYRRYFALPHAGGRGARTKIVTREQLEPLLGRYDVLLPKPRHYWVETNWGQYAHAHREADLLTVREVLIEGWPQYVRQFDRVMRRRSGHRFNMFIMKREVLDRYCEWLFAVLFALERRLDAPLHSASQARVFGYLAERLLDVWLSANGIAYCELPYVFLEKQRWLVKGWRFVKRWLYHPA